MEQLSAYIAGALRKPLPEEVVERAKVHLVDTFAAMISGSRLVPGKRAIAYVKALDGKREAGVIGTRIVTSALNAALANGMSGHADETDDTHPPSRTHPGTSVIPAALAMTERQQLSGEAMLRAIVLGYDICARTVLSLAPKPVNSAFGHLFGAAAATGALLKLDARKIRYVLAYAGQQASGLYTRLRDSRHVEKAYAVGGMPAHNGILAALMVKSGFTGVEDVYSGEPNFFSTFSPDADREALVHALGRDYEIMRGGIKCWSVGGPIQGPLHVLRDMIQQHGLKAENVERLIARMPDKELKIVSDREMPSITVQHLLALMLLDGTVTFASSHDFARMKDPKALALRRRIETVGDPGLTDALRRWRCVMEITLKDGRKLTHQTMAAKGGLENPLTRREEEEKALDLITPVLGKRRAHALIAALWNIEGVKNVRALRKLYAK
ncbi:MAG: MmgE/PrpD family protein [Betaproteobacteria bacterium]|nr:MmgE/PrpD family protein [Betaproteobacteria bacterium]